ncbi:MAG: hypothetical protein ACI8QS_002064 [Planctomycetota bacterium]|jgi:hypothetical protein
MKIRPLHLLLLATFVAISIATFLLLSPDDGGTAVGAETSGQAARPEQSPGTAETSETAEDAPDIEELGVGDLAQREEYVPPPVVLDLAPGQVVLSGRVALPAETPLDEVAHVVALRQKAGVQTLGGGEMFSTVWGGQVMGIEETEEDNDGVLASAEIGADGSFQLILPEDTKRAHLAVTGRYLYSVSTRFCDEASEDITLRPRLGAWITGRVVAADGAPALEITSISDADEEAAGLAVGLFPDLSSGRFNPMALRSGFVSSKTDAEADGSFAFRGVPTANVMGLVARTEQHAMPYETGLKVRPGEHLEIALTAKAGASLAGRVVDENGDGKPEVAVAVILPGLMGQVLESMRTTETAEDGSFTLKGLPSGQVTLVVEASAYLPLRIPLEEPLLPGEQRTGMEVSLDRGGSLAGRVFFPDGAPASDAIVNFSMDPSAFQMGMGGAGTATRGGSGSVDATGHFLVSGLKGGPFLAKAQVEVPDGERAGSWSARQTKVALDSEDLEFRLEKAAEVRVRVTDSDGTALGEFSLIATLDGSAGMMGIGAEKATENVTEAVDGVGVLSGLTAGNWLLDVRADGFARPEQLAFTVPAGDVLLEVSLYPTATVLGRVIDTDGQPVADAQVGLVLGMEDLLSGDSAPRPSAVSDEEGRFELVNLNPGPSALVAKAEDFAASGTQVLDLDPGQIVEDIELILTMGGTVLGQVLDDEGNGKPGMMISAQRPPNYAEQRLDRTDGEGRFVLEHLEAGRWQITALRNVLDDAGSDEGGGMADLLSDMKVEFVEVPEGEVVELILGKKVAGAVGVTVRVMSDDEPVPNALVSFIAEDSGDAPAMKFKMTDGEGRMHIEVDEPGSYLISVQQNMAMGRQSTVEFIEDIPEAEEHELIFELPIGTISGRVYGPDGKALSNCRVTLTVEDGMTFGSFLGGNYAEVVTDEDGEYTIENLRPGTYSVASGGTPMGGMFGGSAPGGRVVRGGVKVSDGQKVGSIDFHLEEAGSISGFVRDNEGNPIGGCAVFVRDESGLLLERFSFVVSADDGSFRYEGVRPGTYFVSARITGRASHESAPVRVSGGNDASVELRLEAATMLLIRVIDKSGKDVQARVRAVDPNGHEVTGMLSMSDIMENFGQGFSSTLQRVGPLAPGRYRVEVTTADGRSATKPVTLDGRAERKLTVRVR